MTVDELLEQAEEELKPEGIGGVEGGLRGLAYTILALVKMLKEIEDEGRGDPEL